MSEGRCSRAYLVCNSLFKSLLGLDVDIVVSRKPRMRKHVFFFQLLSRTVCVDSGVILQTIAWKLAVFGTGLTQMRVQMCSHPRARAW